MSRIVAAFIGHKGNPSDTFSGNFQDAFNARAIFKREVGITFENYASLFILGRNHNDIVLPSGWQYDVDDNRKDCQCVYIYQTDTSGASGLSSSS